ncbi:hypothetical protein, partial [Paenibacillus phytohabitans]|uniref:hypothetical protein n=1 Tax=Paenibacillus phytohabitans TaxID=2654978 RepID=UPI00300BA868
MFISIFGLILVFPNTYESIKTIISSRFDFNAVRINYAQLTSSGRFFYVFFTNNIPVAIFGAVSLIAAIDLVNKRKRFLFIALLNIIIGTLTFGGRFLIINFVIY